jgi:nucleoside-diphosphate-sugar epimerase
MSSSVAVLGASGFVGSRLLELFHLRGTARVRPIVRGYTSLARLSRFDLDWRIADACDITSLVSAFNGCDTVVNLLVANPDVIVANATAAYKAAEKAGVRRMVFMSSASVHGLVPCAGTDELSPLHSNHRFAYNNAKVCAERALTKLRAHGSVELVILRPSIVFGPRSRWLTDVADQILSDSAYLIDEGLGICNAIYVDNLIDAIELALTTPTADRGVFLLNNSERITWFDFYQPIAAALGVAMDRIHSISAPPLDSSLNRSLRLYYNSKSVQSLLPFIPGTFKQAVKGAIKGLRDSGPPSPWELPSQPQLDLSEELCQLQLCTVHLPYTRARHTLAYESRVSFSDGMNRSLGWLGFAGYPLTVETP